jgi:predicted amidohydrolase YtcJ
MQDLTGPAARVEALMRKLIKMGLDADTNRYYAELHANSRSSHNGSIGGLEKQMKSHQHHTRREFLRLAGAAGALGAATPWARAADPVSATTARDAELIVVNANVCTMDSKLPRAQAFAIRGGRFIAVGSTAEMRSLAGKATQEFDAKRMTIVPGFIDCHCHADRGPILLYGVLVGNPFEAEFVTIDSIIGKLSERARQTPPGHWVEGHFYDDTKVTDKREVNIRDLDRVSSQHPVAVRHRGAHTTYYNSKAFELAGITRDTPNPPGGTYDRDASGALTGRVTDTAREPIEKSGQRPVYTPEQHRQRERDGMAHISRQFARYGLTSVHHQGGDLTAIQEVRSRGELLHRVSYEAEGRMLDAMIENGIRTGFGDEWVRFGATREHVADGSFSERTMALSIPYPGTTSGYKGNVTEAQSVLDAWVERVHRAGIQVNCHANGDVAIDSVLTAYERAQRLFPRADARPKITHCTLINDDLLRRIKAIGAVPTPFTTYAYYNTDKFHFYGEELMQRAMAYRSFIDSGITAAAGSDFSPGPFAPLMGIQGMVTRTGWNGEAWGLNQRVTVDEALQITTLNGAYASHEETIKGTITAGKWADYVVLAEDPHTVAQEKIKDIRIVRTVTAGNTVYQA